MAFINTGNKMPLAGFYGPLKVELLNLGDLRVGSGSLSHTTRWLTDYDQLAHYLLSWLTDSLATQLTN